MVRAEPPHAVGYDKVIVDHSLHIIKAKFFDFLNLVRCAKPVKEMQKCRVEGHIQAIPKIEPGIQRTGAGTLGFNAAIESGSS